VTLQLHLVGGFLGSGKTSAIAAAARQLIGQGRKVGVVTNDQGRQLVDTAFLRSQALPVVDVTGGCFCCNYSQFENVLEKLVQTALPDVVFAEAVGSCADVVATVMQPLLDLRQKVQSATFSVFADARFLQFLYGGTPLPFSENVSYIFEKQLEEAQILIVNKKDLLAGGEGDKVLRQTRERYPDKVVLLQDSHNENDIGKWLDNLQKTDLKTLPAMELDYDRYGAGEIKLAWLDLQAEISAPVENVWEPILEELIITLKSGFVSWAKIAHMKIFAECEGKGRKFSLTALDGKGSSEAGAKLCGRRLHVTLNLRAEGSAEDIRRSVEDALAAFGQKQNMQVRVLSSAAFHPQAPARPVKHRSE
jgi:Ni2+-binding GTPase involved in maturation of urease and hydrogenase